MSVTHLDDLVTGKDLFEASAPSLQASPVGCILLASLGTAVDSGEGRAPMLGQPFMTHGYIVVLNWALQTALLK